MSRRRRERRTGSLPQGLSNAIRVAVMVLGHVWSGSVAAQVGPPQLPDGVVAVHEGRLTANLDRIPLHALLEELARRVPMRLKVSEASRDHAVTAHFRALPLEEALARLLAGHSWAFTYSHAPSGPASAAPRKIVELIVLGDGMRATGETGSREATDPTRHSGSGARSGQETDVTPAWLEASEDPDPAVRLRALGRVQQSRTGATGSATLDVLNQALVDPDEAVRARAQELAEQEWAAKAQGR